MISIRCHCMLLAAAVLAGCAESRPTPTATQTESYTGEDPQTGRSAAMRKAVAAKETLFRKLSTRLKEIMASRGPAAAIEVCSREAAQFAKSVGKQYDVAIGRTSFKLRNPRNAPPEWAKPLVRQRIEEPQFVDLPGGATGAMLPIKLKKQCLTCHGPAEQIAADVRAKLDALYPHDQATGFREGDLRGWFWVEVSNRTAEDKSSRFDDWDGTIVQYGRMRDVIGRRKHQGRILLKEAIRRPHLFAVGALEGLRGEVTVLDGKVFAAAADSSHEVIPIESAAELKAALLVGSHVPDWTDHKIQQAMGQEQLERFIEETATGTGIETAKPFVFTLSGKLQSLEVHVIRGACPVHARRAGIELAEDEKPYHGRFSTVQGTLVGVFAKNAAGNITHPETSMHLHVIWKDTESGKQLTGHVERAEVAVGALLRLPRRQPTR